MSEDPKKLLIILKAKAASLQSAEAYLQNRNWEIFSTTEVKTAIPSILSCKASYVLLTVEHANSKVIRLGQIITQTLRIPVIFFAEGVSLQGQATLNELKNPYVIFPPVSGPSIERMILKIARDIETSADLKAQFTQSADLANKAQEQLAQMFSGEPSNSMEFYSHQKGSSGAFSVEQKGPGQNIHNVTEQKNVSSAHTLRQQSREGHDTHSYLNSQGVEVPEINAPADPIVIAKKVRSPGKNIIVGLDKGKSKDAEASGDSNNERVGAPGSVAKTIVLPGLGQGSTDSILIQGAHHAVERVSQSPDHAEHMLGLSTKLHCFFVESEKFRGYVLVAYSQNKDLEKKFKDDLRQTFLKFIKASGIAVQIKDSADISILEVDFEEWSLKESEFLVKSVHAGAEVAVTFFPADEDHVLIEPSADGKMLIVPLEEIEVDVPLDFDLFLYMPSNAKYFHYTKKNGKLSQAQKDRLINSQKGHFHVLAEAKEKVTKYRTTRFVNDKIRKHKSRKAS